LSIKLSSNPEAGTLILEILSDSHLNPIKEKTAWKAQFIDVPIELRENCLEFHLGNESRLLKVLSELIEYYKDGLGIQVHLNEGIQGQIQVIETSEAEFSLFTSYARNIWNGVYAEEEFERFVNFAKTGMIRVPFEKQLLSSFHLFFSKNACNFSVPGTGKTTILYSAFNAMRNSGEIEALLVVCPLSAFDTWIEEYNDCFGYNPSFLKIENRLSLESLPGQIARKKKFDLVLINYDKFNLDNHYFQALRYFLQSYKTMVVLDEAHRIKNPNGVQARTILSLLPFAKSRVILTGTPVTQSYTDLYNIAKFIYPYKQVLNYSLFDLVKISNQPNRYAKEIHSIIDAFSPFFTRIRKSHFDLPPAIDKPSISLTPSPAELIIMNSIKGKKGQSMRGSFIRQLQASTNPFLLQKAIDWSEFEEEDESEETEDCFNVGEEVKSFIDENHIELGTKIRSAAQKGLEIMESGGKVIIWCIFTDTAERVWKHLSTSFKGVLLLGRGNSTANYHNMKYNIENREDAIMAFKMNPEIMFAVANPMAVGEAISLHRNSRNESVCKNAIYLERSFNCAQYLQSRDRIHRVGMIGNEPVNYHFFHFEESIDSRLDSALRKKLILMEEVIESQEIPLFENFNEDVLQEVMKDW
jgi:SNF2 family DNA or RNA helicase